MTAQGPYGYLQPADITDPDVSADTSSAASHSWTLLNQVFTGTVIADWPFHATWQGEIEIEIDKKLDLDIGLVTDHVFSDGSTFQTERHLSQRIAASELLAKSMAEFSTMSFVPADAYPASLLTSPVRLKVSLTVSADAAFVVERLHVMQGSAVFWQLAKQVAAPTPEPAPSHGLKPGEVLLLSDLSRLKDELEAGSSLQPDDDDRLRDCLQAAREWVSAQVTIDPDTVTASFPALLHRCVTLRAVDEYDSARRVNTAEATPFGTPMPVVSNDFKLLRMLRPWRRTGIGAGTATTSPYRADPTIAP